MLAKMLGVFYCPECGYAMYGREFLSSIMYECCGKDCILNGIFFKPPGFEMEPAPEADVLFAFKRAFRKRVF